MIIKHTRDTLSETYLDAVAIRNTVFVKGQGVPRSIEIDANEAYCIHFVLYDDKGKAAATVRLLPNKDLTQLTLQRMAVLDAYQGQGLGSILLKEAEDFAQEQGFQTISLHAQLSALKFYLNNGYQEVGNIFEEAGIQHITVEKSLISNNSHCKTHTTDKETTPVKHAKEQTQKPRDKLSFLGVSTRPFHESAPSSLSQLKHLCP